VLGIPDSTTGPWSRYVHNPVERGNGAVRYPRLVPKDAASAKNLQKRTLTNLYNERPTCLTIHKNSYRPKCRSRNPFIFARAALPSGASASRDWNTCGMPSYKSSTACWPAVSRAR